MNGFRKKYSFLRCQLPALLWAAVISTASSVPGERIPDLPLLAQDKLVHFGIYLLLAWLVHRAFHDQSQLPWLARYASASTVIAVGLYGMIDEIHQLFVPGRSCDIVDWLADLSGGIVAVGLLFLLSWWKRGSVRTPGPD
jgi:VanZ family protein